MADEMITNTVDANDDVQSSIFLTDRSTYDDMSHVSNNIYFVKEQTYEQSKLISMYMGDGKVTDLLDITSELGNDYDISDPGFTISEKFKVPNKLYIFRNRKEGSWLNSYSIVCYDVSSNSFITCGGGGGQEAIPPDGNTIIIDDGKLKVNIQPDGTTIVSNNNVWSTVNSEDNRTIVVRNNKYTVSGILGKNNSTSVPASPTSPTDAVVVVGNGQESGGVTTQSDAFKTYTNGINMAGNFGLYGSGNFVSPLGVPLDTINYDLNVSTSTYTASVLFPNGAETIISKTTPISSITITDITKTHCIDASGSVSATPVNLDQSGSGYHSLVKFIKDSTVDSATALCTNFTASGSTKINILNPDYDISDKNIIHILFFHDGFSVCAIVAGYAMSLGGE